MADNYALVESFANAVLAHSQVSHPTEAEQAPKRHAPAEAAITPKLETCQGTLPSHRGTRASISARAAGELISGRPKLPIKADGGGSEDDDTEGEESGDELHLAPEWEEHLRDSRSRRQLQARARRLRRQARSTPPAASVAAIRPSDSSPASIPSSAASAAAAASSVDALRTVEAPLLQLVEAAKTGMGPQQSV
jgi:hypothetical protein